MPMRFTTAFLAFLKLTQNQNQKPRGFSSVVFHLLFKADFHIVNKACSILYSSFALFFRILGVSVNLERIPFSLITQNSCP